MAISDFISNLGKTLNLPEMGISEGIHNIENNWSNFQRDNPVRIPSLNLPVIADIEKRFGDFVSNIKPPQVDFSQFSDANLTNRYTNLISQMPKFEIPQNIKQDFSNRFNSFTNEVKREVQDFSTGQQRARQYGLINTPYPESPQLRSAVQSFSPFGIPVGPTINKIGDFLGPSEETKAAINKFRTGETLTTQDIKLLKNNDEIQQMNIGLMAGTLTTVEAKGAQAIESRLSSLFQKSQSQEEAITKIKSFMDDIYQGASNLVKTKPEEAISKLKSARAAINKVVDNSLDITGRNFKETFAYKMQVLKEPEMAHLNELHSQIGQIDDLIKSYSEKTPFNINIENLKLNNAERVNLERKIGQIKPQLEEIKGKVLTNDEVLKAAKTSDVLSKVVTRADTLAAEAQILKARQQMTALDREIFSMEKTGNIAGAQKRMAELINSVKVVVGSAADKGRQLQSLAIQAGDESFRTQILKDILKTNVDAQTVIDQASKIDWSKPGEAVKLYRQFIKPSFTEKLTEYRYNSMLSNPRTHLRNFFSNLIQTFATKPATIAFQGDIRGAGQYYKGAITSFGKASDNFLNSFRGGVVGGGKMDMAQIPTGKNKFFTIPSRLMEASDQFFKTIISEGEIARGISPEQAAKNASYSLFRGDLYPEGQGKLLNKIDDLTRGLYSMRKSVPLGDWFIPFLKTPMNVAKQWLEFSPVGFATLPGSANKKEQIAKALIGSIVTAIGAKMALEGKTTTAVPTDKKQKDLFYATGRKPWSVLINGKWVPMATFGVYGFALAAPGIVKYVNDESKSSLTDNAAEKLFNVVKTGISFWANQTPLSGLEMFSRTLQGDVDFNVLKNMGFTASQVIPYQGLLRYMANAVDPIYRKTSGFTEQIQSQIPFLSKKLEPIIDVSGKPAKRNLSDYLAPYSMGIPNSQYEPMYDLRMKQLQQNAVLNKQKKEMEKQLNQNSGNQVQAAEETPIQAATKPTPATTDFSLAKTLAENQKLSDQYSMIKSFLASGATEEQAKQAAKNMGIDYDAVTTHIIKNLDLADRGNYIADVLSKTEDRQATWSDLVKKEILTSGVVDEWQKQEKINESQARALKAEIKKATGKATGGSKGIAPRRISVRATPRLGAIKITAPKFNPVVMKTINPKFSSRIKFKPVKIPKIKLRSINAR